MTMHRGILQRPHGSHSQWPSLPPGPLPLGYLCGHASHPRRFGSLNCAISSEDVSKEGQGCNQAPSR
eukprot:4491129-Amphidinium_carterae.1